MYLQKYLKYKMKYLLLSKSKINKIDEIKQKRGGATQNFNFDELFIPLIEFIKEYNRDKIANEMDLFGIVNLFQVKGGASIKYHLMQRGINTNKLTSDIDLLYFLDDSEDKESEIDAFFKKLQTTFPTLNWNISIINDLITIKINDQNIIDITFYDPNFDMDDDTSMFAYALKQLGFKNMTEYYTKITQSKDIDIITFTSLHFELFSTHKGIENVERYIKSISSWETSLAYFSRKKIELEAELPINTVELEKVTKIIEGYMKQLSPSYIDNLKDKLERYKIKYQIISSILE